MTDQPPHSSPSGSDDDPVDGTPLTATSATFTPRRVAVIGAVVLAIAAVVAVSIISGSDDGPDNVADGSQTAAEDVEADDGSGSAPGDETGTASEDDPGAGDGVDAGDGADGAPDPSADNGADAPVDRGDGTDGDTPQDPGGTDDDAASDTDPAAPDGGGQGGQGAQERPADFEDAVGDAIDAAFERFNAVPVSAEDAAANATSMSVHETQVAIEAVTGVDATTSTIVIRTDLEVDDVILENDTAQGAEGICNVAIADTFAWADWIDTFEVLASNGDVLASCEHPVAR